MVPLATAGEPDLGVLLDTRVVEPAWDALHDVLPAGVTTAGFGTC